MKTQKSPRTIKLILPVIALLFVVVASFAFTGSNKREPVSSKANQYYFKLNSTSIGDENNLSKWEFVSESTPPESCDGSEVLCSVKAPAIASGSSYIIDASQLQSTINMRTDPAVSEREYQLNP